MSRRLALPRLPRLAYLVIGALSLLLLHHLLFPSLSSPANSQSGSISRAAGHLSLAKLKSSSHKEQVGLAAGHERSYDVEIDPTGLTSFTPGDKQHPIERLIARAKKQVAAMESHISEVQSVDDAADEYERVFGMKPPRGFERWFAFTQRSPEPHPPPLPPLLQLAVNPIIQYLSHPAATLRERARAEKEKDHRFSLELVPPGMGDEGTECAAWEPYNPKQAHKKGRGMVRLHGDGAWQFRCNNTLELLLPILPLLPQAMFEQDPPLELAFNIDDAPSGMVHSSFRDRGETLGRAGKQWPAAALHKAEQAMRWTYGWMWSCPDDAPLKTRDTDVVLNDLSPAMSSDESEHRGKTFIADFVKSVDVCYNPDLLSQHNMMIHSEKHRAAGELGLAVATCRYIHSSDLVGAPLDGVWENVEYIPWEEKPLHKVFWRGTATGCWHNAKIPWRGCQRERLQFLTHNKSTAAAPVLVQKDGRWTTEKFPVKEMNDAWFDVGLSNGPIHCTEEDGSCDEMAAEIEFMPRVRKEDATKYKYVIDVDGNGWSSRFRRLLAGNNVVLKSTLYPEWFNDLLVPWYHYVPVKLDYSDLYDILAFFNGAPDGSTPGRDDLAKEIAENGYRFTQERWRMEDMQSFMFLFMLEYWRALSDDRAAASYVPE